MEGRRLTIAPSLENTIDIPEDLRNKITDFYHRKTINSGTLRFKI